MFQKIKKGIKKSSFFRFISKINKNERGVVILGIPLWIIVTSILGIGAIIGYENWPEIQEGLVAAVMWLLLNISIALAKFSADLFNTVAGSALLQKSITRDSIVLHGWAIVRNFANMFVVLGFVVVGLATILRLREYEAQKLLLPLIIVALLINFSLLFTGIIIDATNITIKYFSEISGASGITQPFISAITDPRNINDITTRAGGKDSSSEFISASLSISLFAFITAMIFFIYGILFLFRYVALMCLVILSPLAFVCYVFPATKPIFKKWWEQFTQWAIIGIPAMFFVYLAGHLIQSYGVGEQAASGASLSYWIPTGFLLFAYSLIFQTSAIGASAVMGLATGAVGFAWGATKWAGGKALRGAGFAAEKSGLTQKVKSAYGNMLESTGIRRRGATASSASKGVDEAQKRMANLSENEQTKTARSRPMTAPGHEDKTAAIINKIKGGRIGDLGTTAEQQQAIAYVESHAKSRGYVSTARKDALKLNPNIAANPTELRDAVQKQAPREFAKNIDKSALTAEVLGVMDDKQMTTLANSGARAKRNAMRDLVHTKAGKAQVKAYRATLTGKKRADFNKNYTAARALFK